MFLTHSGWRYFGAYYEHLEPYSCYLISEKTGWTWHANCFRRSVQCHVDYVVTWQIKVDLRGAQIRRYVVRHILGEKWDKTGTRNVAVGAYLTRVRKYDFSCGRLSDTSQALSPNVRPPHLAAQSSAPSVFHPFMLRLLESKQKTVGRPVPFKSFRSGWWKDQPTNLGWKYCAAIQLPRILPMIFCMPSIE